ncbi:fasciclin domain-containing protein [Winogradskyella forsetii]|uniref:fasciclin domain-containing protein n=1 Tax=Winogradskyella forsetii TaxID=2686077 RepID=UPI0015BF5547|nr:fasciclin domain-containing protein [Winogradskyella forsetii]
MKIISKNFKLLTVFLLVIGLTACSDDDDNNGPGIQTTTVVDVALANNLTSLAAALEATDLVTTLQGTGPFTVFAPDNEAFAALLADTGLDLDNLSAAEKTLVTNILLNHVIIGENLDATSIVNAGSGYLSTASPSGFGDSTLSLYFNVDAGTVKLNGGFDTSVGADVDETDLTATNGVIHIIDKVLLPPTVVDMAIANPNFSTLVTALTTLTPGTDFVATLSTDNGTSPAPFTVFAPTNTAFDNLGTPPAEDVLTQVLLHHVIDGANVRSNGLTPNGTTSPETLQGQTIDITLPGTNGNIADVTDGASNSDIGIVAVDVQTANGVIHVVNKVMLPSL